MGHLKKYYKWLPVLIGPPPTWNSCTWEIGRKSFSPKPVQRGGREGRQPNPGYGTECTVYLTWGGKRKLSCVPLLLFIWYGSPSIYVCLPCFVRMVLFSNKMPKCLLALEVEVVAGWTKQNRKKAKCKIRCRKSWLEPLLISGLRNFNNSANTCCSLISSSA